MLLGGQKAVDSLKAAEGSPTITNDTLKLHWKGRRTPLDCGPHFKPY